MPSTSNKEKSVGPKRRAAKSRVPKRRGQVFQKATDGTDVVGDMDNQFMPDQELDIDPNQESIGPRGTVHIENGELMFRQDGKSEEIPAVYHHNIREQLLALAPAGTYDFPHKRAMGKTNVTSFLPSQKAWGPEREHYPPIIFQYKASPQWRDASYVPGEWYHQGRLVLDYLNRPMIRFLDIPDVLATTFPGYAIEAIMRLDSRIQVQDILSRMPTSVQRKSGKVAGMNKGSLNLRSLRFRERAGCLAWREKLGSKAMEEFLEANLAPELKAANTTKGFRDLTQENIDWVKLRNKTSFAAREAKKKATAEAKKGATAMATPAAEEDNGDVEDVFGEADAEGDTDDLDASRYMES